MKISVLGAGLVGLPMAIDLHCSKNFDVNLVDIDEKRLALASERYGISTTLADLKETTSSRKALSGSEIVLNAVPGHMGYKILKTIIEEGKNVVDIAFFPEDPLTLEDLARKNNVIAITDMGVAPGMSHLLSSHAYHQLDRTDDIRIFVGGLPLIRRLPFEYKAVFSPADVIEEYTRTARFIRHGRLVEMDALSEPELIDFPGIGTLEAFNSDGLRTLMKSLNCPNMIEKTLRYPGHIEKIRLLGECGFLSKETVEIAGHKIRPVDLTSRLLFPMWDLGEDEDLTVMKILVKGSKDGRGTIHSWDLLDRYDRSNGIHSMARTTGYAATATVNLLSKKLFTKPGVHPPEQLGKDPDNVKFILEYLADRKVFYRENIEILRDQ